MAVTTIVDMTDAQVEQIRYSKGHRGFNQVDLKVDTKYALVLLELGPGVTQSDYAAIGVAIKTVPGIVEVDLIIDHQTRSTVLANHTQVVVVSADVQLRNDTPDPV